jgi:hypothetical protein
MAVSIRRALSALLAAGCAVAILGAAPQHMEFVQAQQANQAALLSYTWKSRTELKLKGETKNVLLEQVRYDIDGRLQKTQIGGSSEETRERPSLHPVGGVIKHRIVAKKTAEHKELMQELVTLAGSYAHLPTDRLRAFAAQAISSRGEGAERGTIRMRGRNVNQAGDAMTVWLDPTRSTVRRVEIATSLEFKPVDLVVDYRALDNGLSYQARQVLRYPDKQIELTVETYEYQFVGTSR